MRIARGLACLVVSATALAGITPVASAAEIRKPPGTSGSRTASGKVEEARPAFYQPPKTIPAKPGTIIRTEAARRGIDPANVASISYHSTRMLYSSTDRSGAPVAVSSLVVVPTEPWTGAGPRPVIAYAPVTQGMADRCAPSRRSARFLAYEELFYWNLLREGYAVAMTDYQGLGTPGTHTYMNRISQGRAVLDAARAALKLPNARLSPDSPIGIVGYSQGGGAAAAAAELASSWAPELNIVEASIGAPPADLSQLTKVVDGKESSMFMLYALAGLMGGYGIDPNKHLNNMGKYYLGRAEDSCMGDKKSLANVHSSKLMKNGKPLSEQFALEPFRSILAENKIGNLKPSMPVLINHSTRDETIPFSSGKQLQQQWCKAGAVVHLAANQAKSHAWGIKPHIGKTRTFFNQVFAGWSVRGNCGK
ncbi:Lysophospholipase, alpha-beta hydrolase superfamily [Austwickia chelonae]|uniref:Putative lipase n=1 Tax=Austwickia chelonae NBRC 105200 TaxID=1184607 RepID=K6UNC4_9MICO|nr:lipase family protein [Austwickia chelonae]GAB78861.1 putative lipase [Austwickia chelonae NBRC 105200]SEV85468.1 Lysophospholipase, alpha-beta hydrolase superfamily [Austwickia chelonae]